MTVHFRTRGPTLVVALAALLVLPVGCSDDGSPTTPNTFDPDAYLATLPDWNAYSPLLPDEDVQADPFQDLDWQNLTVCSRTECSMTATPEDIVTYDPGSEILYLGSLIQGQSYLGGIASLAELPIRQRAPLTLTIDLHAFDSSQTVNDPTLATVNDAIHDLVAEAEAAGHKAGSDIFFNQTTSHSISQSALSLSMSARFIGGSVRGSLEAQTSSDQTTVAAYFIQKMFTTSIVLPSRPGDLFSGALTKEILDEQIDRGRIGPNNPPVYVSNITWGRMMMLTMTSSMEESRMRAALQASYYGIGGSVAAEHKEVLEQSTIKLVTIGGDAQRALDFLRSGSLGQFFAEDASLTSAKPLSYTLRNLADNSVAQVSETTNYELEECHPMEVVLFKNETNWRDEVLTAGITLHPWPLTSPNVGMATELTSNPGGNQQMTSPLTWEHANTGLPFDFYLSNWAFSGSGALVFNDQEMDGDTHGISIGDVDDLENDDFEIGVTGENVFAISFYIGDNNPSGEDMEIWGASGSSGEEYLDQMGGQAGFVGLISPVPLRRIRYNEDPGGDDIYVAAFAFGTRP